MTSPTGGIPDVQSTATSQTNYAPAVALMVAMMAAQYSGFIVSKSAATDFNVRSTQQSVTPRDLFDELVDFHDRLARSQTDLPEAAAEYFVKTYGSFMTKFAAWLRIFLMK